MTANREKILQRLKKERKQLQRQLEQLQSAAPSPGEISEGSPFGKKEEEAAEAFELEKRLSLEKHLKSHLSEIEYAQEKFNRGTYGKCEICSQDIDPARLKILPEATLCLSCKARQAKSAKSKFTV